MHAPSRASKMSYVAHTAALCGLVCLPGSKLREARTDLPHLCQHKARHRTDWPQTVRCVLRDSSGNGNRVSSKGPRYTGSAVWTRQTRETPPGFSTASKCSLNHPTLRRKILFKKLFLLEPVTPLWEKYIAKQDRRKKRYSQQPYF